MFRVMTKCDKNGKFVPVKNLGKQYWAAEVLENGSQNLYHLTREYLIENSNRFENVKVSASGRVFVTPIFRYVDFDNFEKHFKEGAERYRYKDMQPKLFEEYNYNIDLGDFLLKQDDYSSLIKALVMHRGDIFSSDWEVAALAYAVRNMVF